MNTGLTAEQLKETVSVLKEKIGTAEAERAAANLEKVLAKR
jgi:hypothetical protein